MSLKLVPFESLDAVSYSPSIVTVAVSVAVCEIFSVKEWHDLENQVRGRSRSSKMAPFDRPYATSYWSAIVMCTCNVYLVPFSSYLTLNNIVTLKSELEVTEIGAIQKLRYGFLFAFHSNYGAILYRLRDIATYW